MRDAAHTSLVKACLGYLALRGIPAWKANTGAAHHGERFVRYGTPGVSDVLAILPPHGRFLACECKTGCGRLTKNQSAFQANVLNAGGIAVVVRSVDDLITALEGLE